MVISTKFYEGIQMIISRLRHNQDLITCLPLLTFTFYPQQKRKKKESHTPQWIYAHGDATATLGKEYFYSRRWPEKKPIPPNKTFWFILCFFFTQCL